MTRPNSLIDIDRFFTIDDGCWLWFGPTDQLGYGKLKIKTRMYKAHRLMWEYFYGRIPIGMHVLHRCDVRNCVRPSHLFLGTHQDNMRDAANKGKFENRKQYVQRHSNGRIKAGWTCK